MLLGGEYCCFQLNLPQSLSLPSIFSSLDRILISLVQLKLTFSGKKFEGTRESMQYALRSHSI
jgi:hypothetical protein